MLQTSSDVMRVALCQAVSTENRPDENARCILETMDSCDADLYIFPELFLSGYHGNTDAVNALDVIRESIPEGIAVVTGSLFVTKEGTYNSAVFLNSGIREYRKIHLAHFGPFSEKDRFISGNEPVMIEHKGFRFGLLICYDIFFPELSKHYAMNGADALICVSASPITSRDAFDAVLPARSVENTVYTLYVNNIGSSEGLEFFGESRAISPFGKTIEKLESDKGTIFIELSKDVLAEARNARPTLSDTLNRRWE